MEHLDLVELAPLEGDGHSLVLVGLGFLNLIVLSADVLVGVQPGLSEDSDVNSMFFEERVDLLPLDSCVEPSDIIGEHLELFFINIYKILLS